MLSIQSSVLTVLNQLQHLLPHMVLEGAHMLGLIDESTWHLFWFLQRQLCSVWWWVTNRKQSGLNRLGHYAAETIILKKILPFLCIGVVLKGHHRVIRSCMFVPRKRKERERKKKRTRRNKESLDAISFSMAMTAWEKMRMSLVMLSVFFFTSSLFSTSSRFRAASRSACSRSRNSRSCSKSCLIFSSVVCVWFYRVIKHNQIRSGFTNYDFMVSNLLTPTFKTGIKCFCATI